VLKKTIRWFDAICIPVRRQGSSVTVCGAISAGLGLATKVKLTAVKQKPTHGIFVHG
jgi:hypothetical protein